MKPTLERKIAKKRYKRYLYHRHISTDSDVPKRTVQRWKQTGIVSLLPEQSSPGDQSNEAHCTNTKNDISEEPMHFLENESSASSADDLNGSESSNESEIGNYTNRSITSSVISNSNSASSSNSDSHTDEREEDDVADDIENANNNGPQDNQDDIIFTESNFTKHSVLTMIHALTIKHRLTYEARRDILEVIKLLANLTEDDEGFSTSNYTMSKYFDPDDNCLQYVFYCERCKRKLDGPVTKREFKSKTVTCPNAECDLQQKIHAQSKNMFITVDMTSQLESILKNDLLRNSLTRPTSKNDKTTISDVNDGTMYQELLNSQIEFDLTYSFSTDGAPIFSSSKLSMWPIQCFLNELPPKLRFKNRIFAGIWVGSNEPNVHLMNTFMSTFAAQAQRLFDDGIKIDNKNYKLLPLICPCDSVARPILQNRVQYNGYFGCSYCYKRGEIIGKQVKYHFLRDDDEMLLRTKMSHSQDLEEVIQNGFKEKVRGVKGPSSLIMSLPHFDSVWGFPLDYMHGVILGVVRQLWELWTTYTPENRHTFYIGKPATLQLVNDKLLKIRPPHEIHRLPRSIAQKAKWKASEWKSWILFYCVPCLQGILKEKYLENVALLVKAVYILLKEEISETERQESERMLEQFVIEFQELYGKGAMTYNVHSLLHLAENVKKSGPLWATSTFPFESGIYTIKQQVTGPVGVVKQIAKKMYVVNTFVNNVINNPNIDERSKVFCTNLWTPAKLHYVQKCDDVTFLGSGSRIGEEELSNYLLFSPNAIENVKVLAFCFKRCVYKQTLIHSTDYMRAEKRNDSLVQLSSGIFVEIQKLLMFDGRAYLFAKKLKVKKLNIGQTKFEHILEILPKRTPEFHFVPLSAINRKCILLGEKIARHFVCTFPNLFEIQ